MLGINSNGTMAWEFSVDGTSSDMVGYQAPDSSYWVACQNLDSMIVRNITSTGNILLEKSLYWPGKSLNPHAVVADSLGGVYILGHRSAPSETVLLKLSPGGSTIWAKSYGGFNNLAEFSRNKLCLTKANQLVFYNDNRIFRTDTMGNVLDTTLCSGDSLQIGTSTNYCQFQWSTGDTTSMLTIDTTGEYILVVYGIHLRYDFTCDHLC